MEGGVSAEVTGAVQRGCEGRGTVSLRVERKQVVFNWVIVIREELRSISER